ncbi:spermatogenesis associated 6-like protein [Thalassophryne amazonica]|uniref:spermatogenesis associated 6-like protein n=1 Tax=Thalassophryne amazonica TaxID=390379 RepID=UPI0014719964|nr:spermatogenesis associated 6-like protein [Thalassophryne amazonica]
MSGKALKVLAEVTVGAVSCPGVHLPGQDDVYLSLCVLGQYRQSQRLAAVFPLLLHEKMTFEKIFRHAVDPADVSVLLQYEVVRIELVQLVPPAGEALACFEDNARCFLFPEPKLVPSFSGMDREVLMTRAPHFPGIAPRSEFSSRTTITECSADAEVNLHPNVLTVTSDERISEDECGSSGTHIDSTHSQRPDASAAWRACQDRTARSESRSHRVWEEVHDCVRRLLTAPKAIQRLISGATQSEVDMILTRTSICPGPPW